MSSCIGAQLFYFLEAYNFHADDSMQLCSHVPFEWAENTKIKWLSDV